MPRNGKSEDRTGAREVTVCRSNDDKTPQRPKRPPKDLKRPPPPQKDPQKAEKVL